jgi:pilus assembly protein CpaF
MTPTLNGSARPPRADQDLARRVHAAVLQRLADEPGRDRLDPADQRQLVLAWIQSELDTEARHRIARGEPQLDPGVERAVIQTVENTVWGLAAHFDELEPRPLVRWPLPTTGDGRRSPAVRPSR